MQGINSIINDLFYIIEIYDDIYKTIVLTKHKIDGHYNKQDVIMLINLIRACMISNDCNGLNIKLDIRSLINTYNHYKSIPINDINLYIKNYFCIMNCSLSLYRPELKHKMLLKKTLYKCLNIYNNNINKE